MTSSLNSTVAYIIHSNYVTVFRIDSRICLSLRAWQTVRNSSTLLLKRFRPTCLYFRLWDILWLLLHFFNSFVGNALTSHTVSIWCSVAKGTIFFIVFYALAVLDLPTTRTAVDTTDADALPTKLVPAGPTEKKESLAGWTKGEYYTCSFCFLLVHP
jgi:hypothetical protein